MATPVRRPKMPSVNWPVKRVCIKCGKRLLTTSPIWLVESYDAVLTEQGKVRIHKNKKAAVRWCINCGTQNTAIVRNEGV